MYCLDCGCNLHGVSARQCPECGRPFEPTNLNSVAGSGRGEPSHGGRGMETALNWLELLAYGAIIVGLGGIIVYLLN